MQKKEHWENVYQTRAVDSVSWFQTHAETSLQLIQDLGLDKNSEMIDIGGGASTWVDDLLADGYTNLSVLDLSGAALAVAKERIGAKATSVRWVEADITQANLPTQKFDLWHDRAVFHFLTNSEDRQAYIDQLSSSVKSNGHIIISTFAEDGPTQCSGLPVMRYSVESLGSELGRRFELTKQLKETHNTPFGTTQKFIYCLFNKK